MTIEVILTRGAEFELLNIVDNRDVTYWYLESILNVTATTKKCRFSLDLWCTYILSGKVTLPYLQTNRIPLDPSEVWFRSSDFTDRFNENLKLEAFGNKSQILEARRVLSEAYIHNRIYPNERFRQPQFPIAFDDWSYRYEDLITYAIFRRRKSKNPVVAIPVLFGESFILRNPNNKPNVKDISYEDIYFRTSLSSFDYPDLGWTGFYVMNDKYCIKQIIDKKLDYPVSELGDFVGWFYGPNFWRFGEQMDGTYTFNGIGIGGDKIVPLMNYLLLDVKYGVPPHFMSQPLVKGFLCLFFDNFPGIMQGLYGTGKFAKKPEIIKNITEGLNFLGTPEINSAYTWDGWVTFTNKFVIANSIKTTEFNSEIPSYTDKYFDWLYQTKSQRDMGLNVINQQFGMGLVNGWLSTAGAGANNTGNMMMDGGGFNPLSAVSSTISGFTGGIFSLINTGLQFQNARRQIDNQVKISRLSTSAQLISSDTQFLQTIAMLQQIKYDQKYPWIQAVTKIINPVRNELGSEIMWGYRTQDPNNLIKFIGIETNYYKIDNPISGIGPIEKGYIKFHENFSLTALPNKIISPTIRQALVTLLINGVRVATKAEVENNFA